MFEMGYPELALEDWQPTRDTIHLYAKVIGDVRRALAPRQKHWGHLSLRVTATGITTRPIAAGALIFELQLDFTSHKLVLATQRGEQWQLPLHGQPSSALCDQTLAALALVNIKPELDRSLFNREQAAYDQNAVERFWLALSRIDGVFKRFKAGLREETSPVELWPHHFDLAMLWFSGRRVPGQDPANEDYADEQMNFGFVTGDGSIAQPYFYATAYPLPGDLPTTAWPPDVYWHSQGWNGAVMPYAALLHAEDPDEKLHGFLGCAQQAGSRLMR